MDEAFRERSQALIEGLGKLPRIPINAGTSAANLVTGNVQTSDSTSARAMIAANDALLVRIQEREAILREIEYRHERERREHRQ